MTTSLDSEQHSLIDALFKVKSKMAGLILEELEGQTSGPIDSDTFIKKRIIKRFWNVVAEELTLAREHFVEEGNASNQAQSQFAEIIDWSLAEFKKMFAMSYKRIAILQEPLVSKNTPRRLIAQLLFCLGDIERFNGDLRAHHEQEPTLKHRKSEAMWNFYSRAKAIFPFEGKAYNQLALLSKLQRDRIGTVYYFARALSCQFPLQQAKESLVLYLEELKGELANLLSPTKGRRLGVEKGQAD